MDVVHTCVFLAFLTIFGDTFANFADVTLQVLNINEKVNTIKMASNFGNSMKRYSQTENWDDYQEHLEQYFVAAKVTEEKDKVANLITALGGEDRTLKDDSQSPTKPAELKFSELCKK